MVIMMLWTLLLSTLGLVTHSTAGIYYSVDDLPRSKYDFIVVGGGTAGNVIANRLTEHSKWSVLVIESGPSHEDILSTEVPFLYPTLLKTSYDWNYTSTLQRALNNRVVDIPRGHILGGSSSINAMFYTRGPSSDFDRYARETGDPGWSWSNLQSYIRKNERWVTPVDGHNTSGQYDPAVHSWSGMNSVSLAGYPQITDSRVIQVTKELPDEFPFNQDMNSGNTIGVGWLQSTINQGKRSSSATSYLAPSYLSRPNLHVLVNTRVTRVLPSGHQCSHPRIRAVEVVQRSTEVRRRLIASKEIILSAGAIGTPHILLSSGIGNASELEVVGVAPVLHLPDVGRNLQEHPLVSSLWAINSNDSSTQIPRDPLIVAQHLRQWEMNQTGPFAVNGVPHLIFGRLPNASYAASGYQDPASGENSPHYETIISIQRETTSFLGHFIGVANLVVSPTSRGNITLKSSNPLVSPLIDPGLLGSQFDRLALREAVKSSLRFFGAPAWDGFIIGPVGGLQDAITDKELDRWILQSTKAGDHPVGTAAMSARNAGHGVVDPDLRLKRASGLRVVDASVLPYVPAAHPQAPVYIIAERAADLIKEFWLA